MLVISILKYPVSLTPGKGSDNNPVLHPSFVKNDLTSSWFADLFFSRKRATTPAVFGQAELVPPKNVSWKLELSTLV